MRQYQRLAFAGSVWKGYAQMPNSSDEKKNKRKGRTVLLSAKLTGHASITGALTVIPAEIGDQVNAQIKRIADDRSPLEAAWQRIKETWESEDQDSWVNQVYEFVHDNVSPKAADAFADIIKRVKFDEIPDWFTDYFT